MVEPPIVAVVGATASGKSDFALDLAERLGGEIINTDAMQIYRKMDIGTAKVPLAQRREIPHHLIDIAEVTERANVATFQTLAHECIADCRAREVVPILVGGSALYTRAILDEFEFPGTDREVRARWTSELARRGSMELHHLLSERDPKAAAGILPSNGRRIVRALEVIELRGSFTSTLPRYRYRVAETIQIGVDIDRPTLDARIVERVDRMWAEGLVEETRRLIVLGLREGVTASRAIGYQQVLGLLDGEIDDATARAQAVSATRRFARKQDAWFRKDPRLRWVHYDDPARTARAVEVIEARRNVK